MPSTISFTESTPRKVEIAIPDIFNWDETRLGKLVDLILLNDWEGSMRKYRNPRNELYTGNDSASIQLAYRDLHRAYRAAITYMHLLDIDQFEPYYAAACKVISDLDPNPF